jgi:hypothetical protein
VVIQADDPEIGRTMSALTAQLDDAQLALLDIMSESYLKTGQWPLWYFVEAEMDDKGHDARTTLKSLPLVGSPNIGGRSYGLAWYDRTQLNDDSRPALTAAAGLHVPRLQHLFGDNFIIVLKYLIKQQRAVRPSPDRVERASVTSDDFQRDFSAVTPEFVAALPEIFRHEPVLWRGYQSWGTGPNGWKIELHRELSKYKDVETLADYVDRVVELILEERLASFSNDPEAFSTRSTSLQLDFQEEVPSTVAPVIGPPQYVNADLITELGAKQGHTRLSPDKLLQLMRELNACFAAGHHYACHALVRAIIDHVPPILGSKTFEAAASSYAWPSETDRKYAKKLLEFKNQADDVMHRHIRTSRGVITMHDVPLSGYINALLRVCIDQL